jgi:hypothetical protein
LPPSNCPEHHVASYGIPRKKTRGPDCVQHSPSAIFLAIIGPKLDEKIQRYRILFPPWTESTWYIIPLISHLIEGLENNQWTPEKRPSHMTSVSGNGQHDILLSWRRNKSAVEIKFSPETPIDSHVQLYLQFIFMPRLSYLHFQASWQGHNHGTHGRWYATAARDEAKHSRYRFWHRVISSSICDSQSTCGGKQMAGLSGAVHDCLV